MKKLSLVLSLIFLTFCLSAQDALTIKFTAKQLNNAYQRLDSVIVTNMTRQWTEVLYYPDTTLSLSSTIGISNYESRNKRVKLYQNIPNPFQGITHFNLTLTEKEMVNLVIFDINGKKVAEYHNTLPAGEHTFRSTLSVPQTYLLGAQTKSGTTSIKMINLSNTGERCHIEYVSSKGLPEDLIKKQTAKEFKVGDLMQYIGFAKQGYNVMTNSVTQMQQNSETITFDFPTETEPASVKIYTDTVDHIGATTATLHASFEAQSTTITGIGFAYKKTDESKFSMIWIPNISTPFSLDLYNLEDSTQYDYKAFIRYAKDTVYASTKSFTTLKLRTAEVITGDATGIQMNQAVLDGRYMIAEGCQIDKLGFDVKTADSDWNSYFVTDKNSPFSYNINEGLDTATTYTYRAFASVNPGNKYFYGEEKNFTTKEAPVSALVVKTLKVETRNTENQTAKLYGQVVSEGTDKITEAGFYWGTSANPVQDGEKQTVTDYQNNFFFATDTLEQGTTYYYVAYATNAKGTEYGEVKSFTTTKITLPSIKIISVEDITSEKAFIISRLNNFGGSDNLKLGVVVASGLRVPTKANSVFEGGLADFDSLFTKQIYGLHKETVYSVRAYAENEKGITYSNTVRFKTKSGFACGDQVRDYEWNFYKTVQIGSQCWMAEDMRSKTLPDGTQLEELTTNSNYTTGRYYHEVATGSAKGAILYPWSTACHGLNNLDQGARIQGICPEGWFIPTYRDVADMCRALDPTWKDGGENYKPVAEGNICEQSANNISQKLASPTRLNAVAKGYWHNGEYTFDNKFNMWTSISNSVSGYGNYVTISNDIAGIGHHADDNSAYNGYSVRCVKADESTLVYYQKFENYKGTATPQRQFMRQKPNKSGYLDRMDLEGIPEENQDLYVVFFDYDLKVEKADNYTFRLVSDDGSRLTIDGQRLITQGGVNYKTVRLDTGIHKIEVEFFEYNKAQQLSLFYKTPTTEYVEIGTPEPKGIPDFVYTEAQETVERFNEWKGNDEVLVFPILTDIHTACRTTYKHIGYTVALDRLFHYDLMVNLGDLGLNTRPTSTDRDYSNQILSWTAQEMAKYKGVFLYAPGNHDYDGGEGYHITASELSDIFQKPSMKYANGNLHLFEGNCWSYYDVPEKHCRFIMLNSQVEETIGTNTYTFGSTQMNWLSKVLAETPEGTHVIVMSHFMPDDIGRAVDTKCNKDTTSTVAILEMLKAYIHKTKGERAGITWDFTHAKGDLVGYITGDSHHNAYIKRDGLNLFIVQGYGRVDHSQLIPEAKRAEINGRKMMTVDVIAVKPATKEVHSFRIGAGGADMDYIFDYK